VLVSLGALVGASAWCVLLLIVRQHEYGAAGYPYLVWNLTLAWVPLLLAALNVDPLVWALTGGDDYALAATFPPKTELPDPWYVIGTVAEGDGVRVDGRRWPVGGHEHFR